MIAILDYKAGNLTSVKRALDYLGINNVVSDDPTVIKKADRIIFPGVGHAATAMQNLTSLRLAAVLKESYTAGVPILGICLGTQIILSQSEEGNTECLGLIEGECKKFVAQGAENKIPHMGWNGVMRKRPHPLLADVVDGTEFYFVHSYYPCVKNADTIYLSCEYITEFPAAIGQKNLFATQFHLEKSGEIGLAVLKRFVSWDGTIC
jgi:glutamine amidotransferase